MAAASLVIAITPTRDAIGGSAVVILVLCRLVQGFATGGEYGTSATYMSEAATPERRGFFSSFQYVTLVGGQVLAQTVLLLFQAFLSEQQIESFGWRIAFGLGSVFALVVLWLRTSMDQSMPTTDADGATSGSLSEVLRRYPKQLAICFLVTLGGTIASTRTASRTCHGHGGYDGPGMRATGAARGSRDADALQLRDPDRLHLDQLGLGGAGPLVYGASPRRFLVNCRSSASA